MALPPLPVAIPFIAAAFIAATRTVIPARYANRIAIATAAAVMVICCYLFAWSGETRIVYWFGGWQPRHGVAIGISFVIDRIGAGLAALASLLMLCAFIFSSKYFDTVHALYQVLMLSFLGAMCGFSLTGDLFNLFVFFELMSAAAFALCGYKTEEPGPLQGALNFAITNTIGAFLALSGIGLLYGRTGALNMAQIGRALGSKTDTLITIAFLFLMSGFFLKAAVAPFHFWLADAHAVAPTPVCVLLSGIMVELGLYAVMRVYWTMFAGPLGSRAGSLRNVLLGIGVVTAILGALMCNSQRHIKRLLAFSTISHMGIMAMGFALLAPGALAGTGIYIVGHAMVKSALFLCSGILLHRFASVDEIELLGRGSVREGAIRVTAAVWVLSGLGLAGLPPFGTFLGEAMIHQSATRLGYSWIAIIIIAAEILTGGAVLRAAGRIFAGWGPGPETPSDQEGKIEEGPETRGGHDRVPAGMVIPALVLMLLGLAAGLIPHFRDMAWLAAMRFEDQPGYLARVLDDAVRPIPPPPAAEPLTSSILRGLLAAAGAVVVAALGWSRHYLRRRIETTIRPLRLLHSGEIGDYVTWLTVGVAVFGALFVGLFR